MRWRPPSPAPRPSYFATSVSITPVSRRGWMSSPGRSSPSAFGAATGSRCWSRTEPEWIVGAFAAAKIGAIVAAISTFSTPRELAWTLGALRCSGVDHARRLSRSALPRRAARPLPRARRIGPGALKSTRLPDLRTVVTVERPAHASASSRCRSSWHGAHRSMHAALAAAQQAVRPQSTSATSSTPPDRPRRPKA